MVIVAWLLNATVCYAQDSVLPEDISGGGLAAVLTNQNATKQSTPVVVPAKPEKEENTQELKAQLVTPAWVEKKPSEFQEKAGDNPPAQAPVPMQAPIPPAPLPEPGRIQTLQEAFIAAMKNNADYLAEQQRYQASLEKLPQARAGYLPSVDVSTGVTKDAIQADNAGEGERGALTTTSTASIEQSLYRGGRTTAQVKQAELDIKAASARLRNRQQQVLLQVAAAFLDTYRDRKIVILRSRNVDMMQQRLRATEARLDAGEVTATDVEQAKARLARARSDLLEAEATSAATAARFEEVTGVPSGQYLAAPEPPSLGVATLDEAQITTMAQNPEILQAESEWQAAQKDIDIEYAGYLPQVALSASSSYEDKPSPGTKTYDYTNTVGVRMRLSLYEGGTTTSQLREARKTAERRRYDALAKRRALMQELVSNWRNVETARETINARQAQVAAAKLARDGVQKEAQYGERSVVETLDSEQEYLDAEQALIVAQRSALLDNYRLLSNMGRLVQ